MWSNHRPQWRRPQLHKPHHHLLNLEHKRMAPLRDHRRLVSLDLRLRSCSHHCLLSPEIRPRQRWHHPCHPCRHSSWICRQHHSLYLLSLRRLHRLLSLVVRAHQFRGHSHCCRLLKQKSLHENRCPWRHHLLRTPRELTCWPLNCPRYPSKHT